jgi:hypothetical protein
MPSGRVADMETFVFTETGLLINATTLIGAEIAECGQKWAVNITVVVGGIEKTVPLVFAATREDAIQRFTNFSQEYLSIRGAQIIGYNTLSESAKSGGAE